MKKKKKKEKKYSVLLQLKYISNFALHKDYSFEKA